MNQKPVQTMPARQPPVASLVAAVLHVRVQMPAPALEKGEPVRQVLPSPPHCDRSSGVLPGVQSWVQYPPAARVVHNSAPPGPHIAVVHVPPAAMPVAMAMHVPVVQVVPEPQTRLHAPQLAGSSLTSMQRVPQSRVPDGQVGVPPTQRPAVQVCPSPQRRLHSPQLNTSLVMSMQLAPQVMRGAAHSDVERQVLSEQNWPAAQARPHEPQLAPSVRVSTQVPSQAMRGAVHVEVVAMHVPALQNWPPGHALPQLPQFSMSVRVLTHAPSQTIRGAVHVEVA